MGSLKGATIVRFPDLKKANLDLTNKTVILFCHNGNRSSENAEAMSKMGIDTKFVVGGLEKWVVEGRDMTGLSAVTWRRCGRFPITRTGTPCSTPLRSRR